MAEYWIEGKEEEIVEAVENMVCAWSGFDFYKNFLKALSGMLWDMTHFGEEPDRLSKHFEDTMVFVKIAARINPIEKEWRVSLVKRSNRRK